MSKDNFFYFAQSDAIDWIDPLRFFPRSGNGRIDDLTGGWKERGYLTSFSTCST